MQNATAHTDASGHSDCSSGIASAASALARLLGDVATDTEELKRIEEKMMPNENTISVSFSFTGAPPGGLVWLCTKERALELVKRLAPKYADKGFGEGTLSVLSEVGNIVASAFLNAVAAKRKSTFIPTPPVVTLGDVPHDIDTWWLGRSNIVGQSGETFLLELASQFDQSTPEL